MYKIFCSIKSKKYLKNTYIIYMYVNMYIYTVYKWHLKEHVDFHITHQLIFSQQLYKNHPKSCPMFPAQIWTAANACFLRPRGSMSNPDKIPTTVLVTCLRMRIVWTEFGFSWISRGNVSIKFVWESSQYKRVTTQLPGPEVPGFWVKNSPSFQLSTTFVGFYCDHSSSLQIYA